jgi:uncharacterized protein (TIGR03437 family)
VSSTTRPPTSFRQRPPPRQRQPWTIVPSTLTASFDGSPKPVTVTTNPASLTVVSVTYDGSTTAPSAVGSYAVVATLTNALYQATNATGTLTIGKINQVITVTSPAPASAAYNDTFPVAATAPGGAVSIAAVGPCSIAAGIVTITGGSGTCTITFSQAGNATYNPAPDVVQTTTAVKATATLTIVPGTLTATYDGSPKPVTVTTTPGGLTVVNVTYDGSPTPPTAGGSYAVVATLTNALYQAANATGTLTINVAAQTITVTSPAPASAAFNTTFPVAATAPGGPVVITVTGPCSLAGGIVTMTAGTGTCVVTFNQGGSAGYSAAPTITQATVATKASVSLSTPSVPASSTFGQAVTIGTNLTAPGGGTPTGTITYLNGGSSIGTSGVSGAGPYSLSTSNLGIGAHSITASYSGDGNFNSFGPTASSSITVGPATATAIVSSTSGSSVVYGQPVTLVATFSGVAGFPVGGTGVTVAFLDGATTVCAAVSVASGAASCTTSALSVGAHSITVSGLSGDPRYVLGSVTALNLSVAKASTGTVVSGLQSPTLNQGTTYVASVVVTAPGAAPLTGTVSFTLNGVPVGTCQNLPAGSASCAITFTTGTASIVGAAYSGDANTAASSGSLTVTASSGSGGNGGGSGNDPIVQLTSNNQVPTVAQPITFTAFITQTGPTTGIVRFYDGNTLIGTIDVVGGQARLTTTLSSGGHNITAIYDSSRGQINSNPYNQYVYRIPTATAVVTSDSNPVFCSATTIQAQVVVQPQPGFSGPSGQVQFLDGTTIIGTAPVVNGVATIPAASLGAGAHALAAVYMGDSNWNTSRSANVAQSVRQAPPSVSVVPLPDVSGTETQLSLTAKVGAATGGCVASAGTVQFVDTNTNAVLATAPVVNGVATASVRSENVKRQVTGNYSGNADFVSGSSLPATQIAVVNAASFTSPLSVRDEIMTIFGFGLTGATDAPTATPLPTNLAGASVTVKDSLGTERPAQLFYASPTQINLLIPTDTAPGTATVTVTSALGSSAIVVRNTTASAGIFTANASGTGVAAAQTVRVAAGGGQTLTNVASFSAATSTFVPAPIDLGAATDQTFLLLYGTGLRYAGGTGSVEVTINGLNIPVLYSGSQPIFVGLDQINVGPLPASLRGAGSVDVQVKINGQPANTVTITIK